MFAMDLDGFSTRFDCPTELYDQLRSYISEGATEPSQDLPALRFSNKEVAENCLAANMDLKVDCWDSMRVQLLT